MQKNAQMTFQVWSMGRLTPLIVLARSVAGNIPAVLATLTTAPDFLSNMKGMTVHILPDGDSEADGHETVPLRVRHPVDAAEAVQDARDVEEQVDPASDLC
ncbi:uncharacterized protein ColSpa_03913 [Colletotrichum spaethianum]|uniref:Uncharacterized protein n=1 Tax=Colletotrichum spaethianum TaxID=700344 RepID=A0AA37NVY2_9PEZI|nr:uncharacterized protein ColSpa_03913 [Colletotrichum spaethianum]GKT43732.1 hypothetical protein ColSpa_03913 [Colletotrichum spaethianum]